MKETNLQNAVRLAASKLGVRLFRNNVGSARTHDGRFIVFGLCNGSSDLIGWRTVTITPADIGRRVAVFTAMEIKTPTGQPTPEQLHFIEIVKNAGGLAAIVRDPEGVADALIY